MPVSLVCHPKNETDLLIDRIDAGRFESFLLIVPTKRRIRYLTREILERCNRAVAEPGILTLELFGRRIFASVFDNVRQIEEPVQTLLFGQAIRQVWKSLEYFHVQESSGGIPHGTLEKIVHVIRLLKEVGVYPGQLAEELAGEEAEDRYMLRDIVRIYTAYDALLEDLNGVDAEGVFKLLHHACPHERFAQAFRICFPEVQTVSIVGFDEFTEPELGVLQKLCATGVTVTLLFDFQPGNDALFGHLTANYRRFLEMGFFPHNVPAEDTGFLIRSNRTAQPARIVSHIARHLFARRPDVEKLNCAADITVIRAKDRLAEVECICKLIKQLLSDDPSLKPSNICVALYKPQAYTHLMREQCAKYGIPANITDRFALSRSPLVAAIIGLLEIATRGFRREDVLRSAGSTYFDFTREGKNIDHANLMEVARSLRIVAGTAMWLSRIEREVARLESDLQQSPDEEDRLRIRRQVENYRRAGQDILWLSSLLEDVSRDQTPSGFQLGVLRLLDQLRVSSRIVSADAARHPGVVERDARAYAAFLEVMEQLVRVLEFQDGKDARRALRFYVEQLKLAISRERYNVREQFGEGVLVTSIDETRGLPIETMIVAGLVDGEFPAVYQSELFFGAKRLQEREQRHTWENRYLFYQAITNWSRHLYLSHPEQEAELDLVRSGFVDAVLDIAGVEQLEYPGSGFLQGTVFSEEDLLRHHGASLRAGASPDGIRLSPKLHDRIHYVARALEVERSRVDMHHLPEFEGLVGDTVSDDGKEKLRQLRDRVYSVSQLETYGKCPFQFFAQRILRLNISEEVEEEFSARDKGSVLHEILFQFYTERREQNRPHITGCTQEEFVEANRQLLRIAEERLAALDIPDAFWDLDKELILGNRENGRGLLRGFLEFERNRPTSMRAGFFEVGFGSGLGSHTHTDKTLSAEEPVVAGNAKIRGKIDRVELGEDAFAVVDYKTGKDLPKLEDIRSGISLQLPIYLYTIEQLLEQRLQKSLHPAGGVYYQLRDPVALKVGVGSNVYKQEFGVQRSNANLLPSDEDLASLIDDSIRMINNFIDEMAEGKFPLTDFGKIEKVCTYCEYKTICRIQTVRRVEAAPQEAS